MLLTRPPNLGHRLGGQSHRVDLDNQPGDEAGVEVAVIATSEGLRALQLVLQQFVHQVQFVVRQQWTLPTGGRTRETK